MMRALKNANASKIIDRLPQGLDTIVGAQGGQLSGGEKQRIALARAFIKDPKVLILDEATSALDRQNEKEVQEAIDKFENAGFNITTIVIAHRLSTIRNSDKIIVLKEGKIVEEGDHKSLLKSHPEGVYATLVEKQEQLEENSDEEEELEESDRNSSSEEGSPDTRRKISKKKKKTKERKKSTDHRKSSFGEELKDKKEQADKMDEDVHKEKEMLYKQIKKNGYFKRLLSYNRPYFLIVVGLISSLVQGMSYPIFGIFYVKTLYSIFTYNQSEANFWICIICIIAVTSFLGTYFQKLSFGIMAENMTMEIRKDLYKALLRKHIGWYDHTENNIGVLTSVLASDVYTLNGASTEGLSTLIEAFSGLIGSIILGMIFEWRTALCSLIVVPFFICSSSIQTKLQSGFSKQEDGPLKEANLLISDSISNYKTVASFAHEYLLVNDLKDKLIGPMKAGMWRAHFAGFIFGYSNFFQNVAFALLFFLGAVFMRYDDAESENVFITVFVILFGCYGAGQAQQFAPSTGKAMKSALRIFSIIDEKSDVNVDDTHPDEVIADDNFIGEIEFRNIWFRYPTRPDVWVLKDFSLKIHPKEHIALVGESGSGKSTIVQLIYRFYEPHFGQILIDGVDIKHYNIVSLRRQLGLVQQMPSLFNESVLYNICYGEDLESQGEAISAAEISNATGFIAKLSELENDPNKIIEEDEEIDEYHVRTEDVQRGMLINCGVGGGKLSGGQKQRVAIARAVIRQPKILLLDEATSALDEVSQGKVQEALEQIMKGRTSIVIAHRLTTIENADRIVILKHGQIYKVGKFEELRDDL